MSTNCPTRLLDDLPAESDAFGSHQRIAQAIADLVAQEDGGNAIALTGTWGSGKSTVVRLLESCLARRTNPETTIRVFVYDAWVHQGDPLRRSFLEALISFLSSPEVRWTEEDTWKEDRDRISRRREETDTQSSPVLTFAGRLLAASALLLPLGYTLFGTVASGTRLPVLGTAIPVWIIGLVLSLLPFLVGMVVWLWWRPTWKLWTLKFWKKHRSPHQDDSILAFFVQKTRVVQRSRTIRTPDPTSIEFREIFEKVLAASLGPKDRRLVVVLDNLDRVPPEDALAIWSTMRAFCDLRTQSGTPGNGGWPQKLWLLVPFDRTALQGLWAQRLSPEHRGRLRGDVQVDERSKETPEGNLPAPQERGSQEGQTVAAFVDKSFQVEFRVPPPVLSQWKEFFLEQFQKAFPNHAATTDGQAVYRLFRRIGLPKGRPLAPRDIKLFINKLGSLHRQWKDEIPLPLQALYVLYADRLSEPEHDLVRENFLDSVVKGLVDGLDWQRYLAALHYNVTPDDAYQVLIGRKVEECLRTGDVERFSELANIPAAATVCDHVLEENWNDWATTEPSALAHSAFVLHERGSREGAWTACWSWLAKGLELVEGWNGLDGRTGEGIVCILLGTSGESREKTARSVIKAIQKDGKLAGTGEGKPAEEAIRDWVDGGVEVVSYLNQSGFDDLLRGEFRVPGTAGAYIVALRHVAQKAVRDTLCRYFVPQIERQAIVEEMARICSAGQCSEAHTRAVRVMVRVDGQWPWEALLSAMNQRLQGSNRLAPDELSALLETLLILKNEDIQPAEVTIENLCRQGHLMRHLHAVQSQPKNAALPILAYLVACPDGNIQTAPGNANAGKQFYQSLLQNPGASPNVATDLANLCLRLHMPAAPVDAYKTASQVKPLAAAIFGEIVRLDDVEQHLPSDYVVAEWEAISRLLNDEQLESLVAALIERGDLAKRLVSNPPEIGDGRLYFLAYAKASPNHRQSLAEVLTPMLQAVGKESWLSELEREGWLLKLALMVVEDGNPLDLGAEFHDALVGHAKKVIHGSQAPPRELVGKWRRLPQALDEDRRQTFARNLWDELANNGSSTSLATFLKLYGQYLVTIGPPDPDEAMRRVCSPIMGRSRPEEIAWVASLLETQPGCLEQAKPSTRRDFEDRVKAKLRERADDALRPMLERIGSVMGLSPDQTMEDSKNGGEPSRGVE